MKNWANGAVQVDAEPLVPIQPVVLGDEKHYSDLFQRELSRRQKGKTGREYRIMKLLTDLFACQTDSRFRGIGRYTLSLTRAMARLRGSSEMIVLADALYPESLETLRQDFLRFLPLGAFLPYYHVPLKYDSMQPIRSHTEIAATLVRQAYQAVSPDVVFTPSPFEGWRERGVVPTPESRYSTYHQVAILYDLIPYIFREQYLKTNPGYKKWYLEKLNNLPKYDLLLAISEATRQDAINNLGIEPDRVVNISGAASSQFRKLVLTDDEKQAFLNRFGISRPFVLYIAGGDFRKNREGALLAYAQLPHHIIEDHQLVFSYSDDRASFKKTLRSWGFAKNDVVVLSYITDEDLIMLYNLCKLFFFPSLYEGFGLPVLEAMACGAPVIASNNSSLPEVVGRPDALFDASRPQEVTQYLHHALTYTSFTKELAAYGLEHATRFSWENSAKHAWDAIESMQKEKERAKSRGTFSIPANQPRMRIAYVSPFPPQKSGIADYSAELLPHLMNYFDIDLFVQPDVKISDPFLRDNFRVYTWDTLLERRDGYATVVYQVGNSPLHSPMTDLLREMPGVVVLHDFFLNNIPFTEESIFGKKRAFLHEINNSHGLRGVIEYIKYGIGAARFKWPINWRAVKYAQELIVHFEYKNDLTQQFYAFGWKPRPTMVGLFGNNDPQTLTSTHKNIEKVTAVYVEVICRAAQLDE